MTRLSTCLPLLLVVAATSSAQEQIHGADCKLCEALGRGGSLYEGVADPESNRRAFDSALAAVNNCLDITLLGDREFRAEGAVLTLIKQYVQDESWIYSLPTGAVKSCTRGACRTDPEKAEALYRVLFGGLVERAPGVKFTERVKLSCQATFVDAHSALNSLRTAAGEPVE